MTNLKHNYFILQYVYYSPLHVSSNVVLIISRSKCTNIASGIITLCKWPSGMQVEREPAEAKTVFFYVIYELINKQFLKSSTSRYISDAHFTLTALWMTWLKDQRQVALLIPAYHPSTDYSAHSCSNLWTTSCSVQWSSLSSSQWCSQGNGASRAAAQGSSVQA